MFKWLYQAFCVRVKRPGLVAVDVGGDYEGLVEPVFGGKLMKLLVIQPAKSYHRCGRHGNSSSDLNGTGIILEQGCAQVVETGLFCSLLAVHSDVCIGVGHASNHDLRIIRADLNPVCFCSYI
ncbi:hypothetical protein DPMN_127810 [Dreissena polymorpha]|uniref:Uncharacterized protein n=1 Tax=Dreissena polymorpha TaxID=45954 RepID=A0A9D4GYE0_DREPO|nr:hypothetical protein DPMN_127810 [Dreissena polymorpha]